LSLPVVVKLAITAYVDLGLVFFSTAGLLFFFQWLASGYERKRLVVAALFCGLGLGTKYNGLLVLFLLALFVPYAYARLNPGTRGAAPKAIGYGVLFVLVALIVFSPWMIRNYAWTHNPLFPLYDKMFNPGSPFPGAPLKPFALRRLVYHESWPQIAAIPLRIFFQGQDDSPQYFDGRLNPFLLLLPLLAFRRTATDTPLRVLERQLLAAFAVFYILYAFFTKDMRIRYLAPALPALVILAMFGLRNGYGLVRERISRPGGTVAAVLINGAVVLMLVLNGRYVVEQFRSVAPLPYISGHIDRDTYIQKYRPEYAVLQYVNAHLPVDARLLALFMGRRSYFCDREMVFGIELLQDITRASQTSEEIGHAIAQQGLTHLVVGRQLYETWQGEVFNPQERERLDDFWRRYTTLIYRRAGYELYRLQNAPS
jgi:hypothetical protein